MNNGSFLNTKINCVHCVIFIESELLFGKDLKLVQKMSLVFD